ncbi:MAG: 3'-5' exonuclease [Nitrososphaerales archaeon]|nr:3'-5' exonuclease [Nitrososphaerales archaeon]
MIVVDLQTTGWNDRQDRIVSIGAVDFENPARLFHQECRTPTKARISPEAWRAFRFDRRSLFTKNKPTIRSTVQGFISWSESSDVRTLAGQNPWFDAAFLRTAAKRYHLDWPFGYRHVDLHSIFYARFLELGLRIPTENGLDALGLSTILRYTGLERRRRRHNALTNAKLEAEALSRLICGKVLFEEYRKYKIPPPLASSPD